MGIGIWYEMWISDPVAFLFKNTDPRGSLRANVSNSAVRCLSNMPLGEMLGTRHSMSQSVRAEVSAKSSDWGYKIGSVYIRKVHFRDAGMIRQIEEKVVNRLRQVTSAIRQAGANQVSVIRSSAEREAAVEFARAAVIRPATLRRVFQEVGTVPEVSEALFQILETQRLLAGTGKLVLLPGGGHGRMLANLMASDQPSAPETGSK
jgi:regulator of protease activity HflC (stomatin/prohibitin superfamily)